MLHVSAYQNADTLAFFENADTLAFLIWKSVTVPAVFKDTPKKTNAGTVAVLFQMWTCISTFKAQTQKVCQFHQFGRVNAGKCDS